MVFGTRHGLKEERKSENRLVSMVTLLGSLTDTVFCQSKFTFITD